MKNSTYYPQYLSHSLSSNRADLVYEFCQGKTLKHWILHFRPSLREKKKVMRKMAEALLELKEGQIVHRDIKP